MQKNLEGTAHRPSNEEGGWFFGGQIGGITDYTGRFDWGRRKIGGRCTNRGVAGSPTLTGRERGLLRGRGMGMTAGEAAGTVAPNRDVAGARR